MKELFLYELKTKTSIYVFVFFGKKDTLNFSGLVIKFFGLYEPPATIYKKKQVSQIL